MLTVYTKNNCIFCMQAKALLNEKGFDFVEKNIEEDADAREFLIAQGHRTMPQIYDGDILWVEGGYTGLSEKINTTKILTESIDTSSLGTL